MISKEDIEEVRKRDFLKKVDHYHDYDNIRTELIWGDWGEQLIELTIIVPVYDHPKEFVERAIRSVLRQPCSYSYKLLIIDDYTETEEPTAAELFIRELQDDRIIYYKNAENLGVFANWNRAIMLSRTEWITFLHTDDFLMENYLENMMRIVKDNPQIDQLSCNYKLLNYKKDEIDSEKEYKGHAGKRIVRKVDFSEYMYQMITTVKGAFYKRQKIIEIGGFRSQGDGIGLDDYPLMLRFAYYYNTYLLEDCLYLDSWGYNDSLNPKHWYPELVENYYMWIYFANRESGILKKLYLLRARQLLIWRARLYKNGHSWVGMPIEINYKELISDCGIKSMKVNYLQEIIVRLIIGIAQKKKKSYVDRYTVEIKNNDIPCSLYR